MKLNVDTAHPALRTPRATRRHAERRRRPATIEMRNGKCGGCRNHLRSVNRASYTKKGVAMDAQSDAGSRGAAVKGKVGRRTKGHYKAYSIKTRIDIATELEALVTDGVTRTDLFEAAVAMALRDTDSLLAEVVHQRRLAAQHRRAAGLPPTKGDQDVAA